MEGGKVHPRRVPSLSTTLYMHALFVMKVVKKRVGGVGLESIDHVPKK